MEPSAPILAFPARVGLWRAPRVPPTHPCLQSLMEQGAARWPLPRTDAPRSSTIFCPWELKVVALPRCRRRARSLKALRPVGRRSVSTIAPRVSISYTVHSFRCAPSLERVNCACCVNCVEDPAKSVLGKSVRALSGSTVAAGRILLPPDCRLLLRPEDHGKGTDGSTKSSARRRTSIHRLKPTDLIAIGRYLRWPRPLPC